MEAKSSREIYLSVLLSCYNESSMIEGCVSKLIPFLETLNTNYELIVIDDFSKDKSVEIIRNLQANNEKIKLLRNPRNMGKGFSIKNGMLNCRGTYIVFTDMDMAYSLDNIKAVLSELENGSDIVVGNRRLVESVYTVPNRLIKYVYRRHSVGMIFNFLVRHMFGLTIRDTQSGLKGFNRATALSLFPRINTDRFVFDVEIFILAKALTKKVKEVPVHLNYFSQLSTVNILRYSLKALAEIASIKFYQLRGKYSQGERSTIPAEAGQGGHLEPLVQRKASGQRK